jgi:hypothetical protein
LVDELVDKRSGALTLRGGSALRRADPVGRPHARPSRALPRHQATEPGSPRDPPGRQLSRSGRRFLGRVSHPISQSSRQAAATLRLYLVEELGGWEAKGWTWSSAMSSATCIGALLWAV